MLIAEPDIGQDDELHAIINHGPQSPAITVARCP